MGCFLACFGSSKDHTTPKLRFKVQPQPRFQRNPSYNAQSTVSLECSNLEKPISPVPEFRGDKTEEQLGSDSGSGSGSRKKVTFDTDVKTYEHVLVNQSSDFELHNEEGKVKEEKVTKSRESNASSEHYSITCTSRSYPHNHRYQNCRESDDEEEELCYDESDLDDDQEEFDDGTFNSIDRITKEVDDSDGLVEEELNPIGFIRGVRGTNGNVQTLLNPVEDQTQWKAVKAKGETPSNLQKENLGLDQEQPREPDQKPKKLNNEVAVNASLSNWLHSTETTPERSMSSQGSNSVRRYENRPILGVLTFEDINKFSETSSPRKAPRSKSPDEIPIIGTVGTYWNQVSSTAAEDSGSATSFKGIPNTNSKYREDKKVNWHSTPFETRLERALKS